MLVEFGPTCSSKRAHPLFAVHGVGQAGWKGRKSCRAIAPGLTPAGSTRPDRRHIQVGPPRRTGGPNCTSVTREVSGFGVFLFVSAVT
jgi:hypothetical protein